jgi:DNA-binding IclR family transcriptional regulator
VSGPTGTENTERAGSQTLERGLAVLDLLGQHPGGLSVSQVTAASGMNRSIVNRLLVSLQRTGFASRDEQGRYSVGPSALSLARGGRTALREIARPLLHRLAHDVGATASLVEVLGDLAVTTAVAEPPTDGPRFSYRLGNRAPVDRGAGGLAAMASGPRRAREPARVTEVREAGHVVTRGELNAGAIGVAVPLTGCGVLAAVNVVTAQEEVAVSALEPLRRVAAQIVAALD